MLQPFLAAILGQEAPPQIVEMSMETSAVRAEEAMSREQAFHPGANFA